MKAFILLALACAALAQTRCKPPPTFETRGLVEFNGTDGRRGFGEFGWAHDISVGKAAEDVRFDEPHTRLNIWFLEDYTAHKRYEENSTTHMCREEGLNGTIQDIWAWVATATFIEKRSWRGREIDVWGAKFPHGLSLEVGCFAEDPTRPIALFEKGEMGDRMLEFREFRGTITNTSIFRKLPNCP